MVDIKNQVSALMRRVRQRGQLPSSADIVDETFRELGYVPGRITPEEVLDGFHLLLRQVWEQTLGVLERHEGRSYAEGIPRELADEYPAHFEDAEEIAKTRGFRAGVMRLFASWYPLLRRCFLRAQRRSD